MESSDVAFLRYIVERIVEHPEEVEIERISDERGILLILKCAKSDAAKVIGKQGQTIIAMRVLLRIVGAKINARIGLRMHDSLVLSHNKTHYEND